MNAMTTPATPIIVFGADWCRDCRRVQYMLNSLGAEYTYIDLDADTQAAMVAQDISGHTSIPVLVYPDQSFQVEPSNADIIAKVSELTLTTPGDDNQTNTDTDTLRETRP